MQRFRLPLLIGTLLTVLAVACAGGINQGIATFVLGLPSGASLASYDGSMPQPTGDAVADGGEAGSEEPATRTARRRSKGDYQRGILSRNIFDADAIGKEDVEDDPDGEGVSDLKVELRATLVAVPAEFSSAYLVETGSGTGGAFGIGQNILGAEIIAIEKTLVRIRNNGKEEVIKLAEASEDKKRPTAARKTDDDGDIAKTSDNEFEVSRELVDKHLENLDGISRLGRAIPHRGPDGNIDGYRLSGIRRGTVGEKLGIRNGDIVHKVNGYELNSMSEAMKAFQELQNDSNFEFSITRRGKQQTMRYNVR